ncbi:hypothetical protein [Sinorhizobium fredii]|uniref:hypothetical protein n=1 Tax=Rhizobium fredii TaxID=380 RepID=UPI0013E8A891|nr:hypothetical protein [Sinorhizobium fredii]
MSKLFTDVAPPLGPSVGGISHNPLEYTPDDDLVAGANVLLDVVKSLASAGWRETNDRFETART